MNFLTPNVVIVNSTKLKKKKEKIPTSVSNNYSCLTDATADDDDVDDDYFVDRTNDTSSPQISEFLKCSNTQDDNNVVMTNNRDDDRDDDEDATTVEVEKDGMYYPDEIHEIKDTETNCATTTAKSSSIMYKEVLHLGNLFATTKGMLLLHDNDNDNDNDDDDDDDASAVVVATKNSNEGKNNMPAKIPANFFILNLV